MNDLKDNLRIRPLKAKESIDPERVLDILLKRISDPKTLTRMREKISLALRLLDKQERSKKREAKTREKEAALGGVEDREMLESDWSSLMTRIESAISELPQDDLPSIQTKRERLGALRKVCDYCKVHDNRISYTTLRELGFFSSPDCHKYLQTQVTPNFCFRAELKASKGSSPDQFYFFTKIVPKESGEKQKIES